MEKLETSRDDFAVLTWGDPQGSPVLALHGFPDGPWTFESLGKKLAGAGYYLVAPYMRGHVPSPGGDNSMKALGQDVLAQAAALGQKVHLIGHDYGAQMGYEAVNLGTEQFATATFLAVCHPNTIAKNLKKHPLDAYRLRHVFYFSAGNWAQRRVPAHDFAYIEKLWKRWSPQLTLPQGYMEKIKQMYRQSWPNPVTQYQNMKLSPLRGKFTVPTLQILGEQDGTTSKHTSEGNSALFAGEYSELNIADAGHFTHLDAPQEVEGQILNWLNRHEAKSG